MQRVIDLVKTLNRPGVDNVIAFLQRSDFQTAQCVGHHKYSGGLIDHLLEVYEIMMQNNKRFDKDTIVVCALFHDLGKARMTGYRFKGPHEKRSIKILEQCGFPLTEEESFAILNHHPKTMEVIKHPLFMLLSKADMESTGRWKHNNPNPNDNTMKRLKNLGLYLFAKL